MAFSYRRLVTGYNSAGRSALVSDVKIAEGSLGNIKLWTTRTDGTAGQDAISLFPEPGATKPAVFLCVMAGTHSGSTQP
jgi:hypothetical protein